MATVASVQKSEDVAFVRRSVLLLPDKPDRVVTLRLLRLPKTEEQREAIFAAAEADFVAAAKEAKEAKRPVLRFVWDFGCIPLDPSLSMPSAWLERNREAMKTGLLRSAVIVANLFSKRLVPMFHGADKDLPPSQTFRDNKTVKICGAKHSLGAWDAYNYILRGEGQPKFTGTFLAKMLADPDISRKYLPPWQPTSADTAQ